MVEKYDVVVVGGGPAGLAAAKAAATEGGKVLLLELRAQIGGQTQPASWAPKNILTTKLKRAVAASFKEIKLHSPHAELTVHGEFGAILDRSWFDKLLAEEAVSNGADIWPSTPVKEFLVKDGVVNGVHAEAGGWSEKVEAGVVVDASGTSGEWSALFLRQVLHMDCPREHLVFSNEYLMANAGSESSAELFFNSYFAPAGHAWIYPMEGNFVATGIQGIRIHPDAALDEFIGKQAPKRLAAAVPLAAFRNQFLSQGPLNQTCANGIITVGGAAGQVYPLSGQTLRYALRCGELAGKVAVDAITDGDISRERLSEYERGWTAEFGQELEIGKLLRASLSVSQDGKMDALLSILKSEPKLQRAFIDIFTGFKKSSLRLLLKNEEIVKIFGRETAKKALEK